eukprot:s1968_g16.t1
MGPPNPTDPSTHRATFIQFHRFPVVWQQRAFLFPVKSWFSQGLCLRLLSELPEFVDFSRDFSCECMRATVLRTQPINSPHERRTGYTAVLKCLFGDIPVEKNDMYGP